MIHFSTLRVGEPGNSQPAAQLFCETLQNSYSVTLLSDGREFLKMNCQLVDTFPERALSARHLVREFRRVRESLAELLTLPENSPEYRGAWWKIKESLKTPTV